MHALTYFNLVDTSVQINCMSPFVVQFIFIIFILIYMFYANKEDPG